MTTRNHEASYVLDKLTKAVGDMAGSDGSLADRIHNAFVAHLHVLAPADFPVEVRELWESLYTTLTAAGPDGERGSVENTLDGMNSEQLLDVAERIVKLWRNFSLQSS